MRKIILVISIFTLVSLFPYNPVFAEENKPVLDQADIEITIDNNVYTVKEKIILSNLNGKSITHYTKEITENKVENVIFSNEEGELIPVIDTGETLHNYTIEPNSDSRSKISYTIEYNVEKQEDEFEIPLFVPEYATYGEQRVVSLSFQAPDGNKIQKNSFPVVLDSDQSYVEVDMANVPGIAKYIYSEHPTSIHSFSIISFIAIFSIFLILAGWAIVEIKKGGKQ